MKLAKILLNQYPSKYILADKGYTSNKLKQWCNVHHEHLWTPPRRNSRPMSKLDFILLKLRRHIESVFAQLNRLFGIENNLGKCITGFQSRLEQGILTDTLLKLGFL